MAELAYALCAITAAVCACLLMRAYVNSGFRLLLWGGLCFVGLTLNNVLLVIDKILLPVTVDLSVWRMLVSLVAVFVLLAGLILDGDA